MRSRQSSRLKTYDYGQAGLYFITCVTLERQCTFGDVQDDEMVHNAYGELVLEELTKTPQLRPTLELDAYVVMPNHVHFLLSFPEESTASSFTDVPRVGMPHNARAGTLGAVVGAFKSVTTRRIRAAGLASFGWQRNYHEHIVRTEASLERIRRYIENNPKMWLEDAIHPDVKSD